MRRAVLVGLALVMSVCGCGRITYEVRSDRPVLLGPLSGRNYEFVKKVDDEGMAIWILYLLLPMNPGRGRALEGHVAQGDAVTEVSVHEYYNVIDWLVQSLTDGLVGTMHEDFDGNIVRYK